MNLAETGRRVRTGWKWFNRVSRGTVSFDFDGCGLWDANTGIPVEVLLGTSGAIAFAGVFVTLASQFVTPANTITIAGFRRRFYRYEGHGVSLEKDNTWRSRERREKGAFHARRFFNCVRRKGEPRFSRSPTQFCSGIDKKTSTILGSNCVPEQRRISSQACLIGRALRYGRSLIMASNASAIEKIRAPRGICSPRKPRG